MIAIIIINSYYQITGLGPAIQVRKPLSSPRVGALKASFPHFLFSGGLFFVADTGVFYCNPLEITGFEMCCFFLDIWSKTTSRFDPTLTMSQIGNKPCVHGKGMVSSKVCEFRHATSGWQQEANSLPASGKETRKRQATIHVI